MSTQYLIGNIELNVDNQAYDLNEFNPESSRDKYRKHQQRLFTEIVVLFPNLRSKYDEFALSFMYTFKAFSECAKNYNGDIIEKLGMKIRKIKITNEEKNELTQLISNSFAKLSDLKNSVISELDKAKNDILV